MVDKMIFYFLEYGLYIFIDFFGVVDYCYVGVVIWYFVYFFYQILIYVFFDFFVLLV